MAICDKVAVMNDGQIHQLDKPHQIINNPESLFVSSFILGNNIIQLSRDKNKLSSIIDNTNVNLTIDQKVEFLSISPKSFSLKESVNGKGVVVAKEFLGDYYIYKVKISDMNLRVRTNINQNVKTGKRCDLSLIKGSQFFLFPGGYKRNVA